MIIQLVLYFCINPSMPATDGGWADLHSGNQFNDPEEEQQNQDRNNTRCYDHHRQCFDELIQDLCGAVGQILCILCQIADSG